MKRTARNAWLGLAALVSLLLYILACASFSPDDTKVLFPAFDPESGRTGLAVYDRTAKRTEMVLVLGGDKQDSQHASGQNGPFIRAQFIDKGSQVLAAWLSDDEKLQIATFGHGSRRPLKVHTITLRDDAGIQLTSPLAVSGNKLFFSTSKTNYVELDLETAALRTQTHDNGDPAFFFTGENGDVFYALSGQAMAWGRLNPATLKMEPIGSMESSDDIVAFDLPRGRFVSAKQEQDGKTALLVTRNGKEEVRLKLQFENLKLSQGVLSRDGQTMLAGYFGDDNSVGIIEVPLRKGAISRKTPLTEMNSQFDGPGLIPGLSHDGKTAALVTTLLEENLVDPKDAGLFLVDLKDPRRKVTRVSMPPKPKKEE